MKIIIEHQRSGDVLAFRSFLVSTIKRLDPASVEEGLAAVYFLLLLSVNSFDLVLLLSGSSFFSDSTSQTLTSICSFLLTEYETVLVGFLDLRTLVVTGGGGDHDGVQPII